MKGNEIMDNKELCYMLDLDPDTVEDVNITRKDEKYVFSIVMKRQTYECPECHSSHVNIKANKSKKLVGAQFNNCPSIYMIHFKRLCCRDCGSSFYDHVPLADETTKIARVTQLHILEDLKPFNSVFASVARKYDISTTKVISLFDENVQVKRHPLPRILLIDEFYFQRHSQQKYAFVMMNFENKVIVDIIKSRWQNVLSDYFYSIDAEKGKGEKREKEKVEFVCSDLYEPYRSIIATYFKNATYLVDHFHVVKLVNDQLNNTRKREMRKHSYARQSKEYRLLKFRYKLLMQYGPTVDIETYRFDSILGCHCVNKTVLDEILSISDDIKAFYDVKEAFMALDDIDEKSAAEHDLEKELDEIIKRFHQLGTKEGVSISKTLKSWKREYLNSFTWVNGRRISNGPPEGKNNYIKKILSNANGYRNFNRARNKIMFSQNLHNEYDSGFSDLYIVDKILNSRKQKAK